MKEEEGRGCPRRYRQGGGGGGGQDGRRGARAEEFHHDNINTYYLPDPFVMLANKNADINL
jgi:hypothetical protein